MSTCPDQIESLMGQGQWEEALQLLGAQSQQIQELTRMLYYRLRCLHKLGRNEELLQVARGHEEDHPSIVRLVGRARWELAQAHSQIESQTPDLADSPEVNRPQPTDPTASGSTAKCPKCGAQVSQEQKQCCCGEWVLCPRCASPAVAYYDPSLKTRRAKSAFDVAGMVAEKLVETVVPEVGGLAVAALTEWTGDKAFHAEPGWECRSCGHFVKEGTLPPCPTCGSEKTHVDTGAESRLKANWGAHNNPLPFFLSPSKQRAWRDKKLVMRCVACKHRWHIPASQIIPLLRIPAKKPDGTPPN